jgi:hypothetical protein
MKIFFAIAASLLAGCSVANAGMTCSDLKYGSERYEEHMMALAKQANLPGQDYTRHHERFIASHCSGDAKTANALVEHGSIPPKDAASIRRLVEVGSASPALGALDTNSADKLITMCS